MILDKNQMESTFVWNIFTCVNYFTSALFFTKIVFSYILALLVVANVLFTST